MNMFKSIVMARTAMVRHSSDLHTEFNSGIANDSVNMLMFTRYVFPIHHVTLACN